VHQIFPAVLLAIKFQKTVPLCAPHIPFLGFPNPGDAASLRLDYFRPFLPVEMKVVIANYEDIIRCPAKNVIIVSRFYRIYLAPFTAVEVNNNFTNCVDIVPGTTPNRP